MLKPEENERKEGKESSIFSFISPMANNFGFFSDSPPIKDMMLMVSG